jgi:microcystin-dependent protein
MAEGFIAEVKVFAGNFAPRSWAFCNGALLSISQNTALFSLVGTIYGGDGRTTFGLPDLRGRSPVGAGTGPGLSTIQLGSKSGAQAITLNVNNMPNHSHSVVAKALVGAGNTNVAAGNVWSKDLGTQSGTYSNLAPDGDMSADAIAETAVGGGQSFNILDPYLGMHWIICLSGLFPSRN